MTNWEQLYDNYHSCEQKYIPIPKIHFRQENSKTQ